MRCDECGAAADEQAEGWIAVRLDLDDDPEPPTIAIFCPQCVKREFGGKLPLDDDDFSRQS